MPVPRRSQARRVAGPRILAALTAVQAAALAGGADHDGCGNTRCEGRPFRLDTRAGSRRGVSRVGRGYAPGAWLACPGRTPLLLLICGCRGCRSEEHTSELQSLMRISYAVFCLKKKKKT